MIKYIIFIFLFFNSVMLQAAGENTYILGAGDQIKIVVYNEPDLTVALMINDNGYINFPLMGAVSVTGRTTSQVQALIQNGLDGDYLLNPSVQVDVVKYRPFYIHGEVNSPGAYSYQPGMTINQAVALAGGFTARASTSKMYVKKANQNQDVSYKVNLTSVISAGDTVTIKQSFF